MKVAQSLSLGAVMVIATCASALAGPQSALDPYAAINAPSGFQSPKKAKIAPPAPVNSATVVLSPAGQRNVVSAAKSAESAAAEGGGVMAGTKQIFHGIATMTKGAMSGIAQPTKRLGQGIATGAKNSGRMLGTGVKVCSDKVKDGTEATGKALSVVPKKVGDGLKLTGEKMKDASEAAGQAIAAAPQKVGGGLKISSDKVKESSAGVGSKLVAGPAAVGRGIAGACVRTGGATKKMTVGSLSFMGRFVPFRKTASPVQTATPPGLQTH